MERIPEKVPEKIPESTSKSTTESTTESTTKKKPEKIRPVKQIKKWEKYNCTGKLRLEVKVDKEDTLEVIALPKHGGCEFLIKAICAVITAMSECNIDHRFIVETLRKVKPCGTPTKRMQRENLPREQVGVGGCAHIIADAIEDKLNELQKQG